MFQRLHTVTWQQSRQLKCGQIKHNCVNKNKVYLLPTPPCFTSYKLRLPLSGLCLLKRYRGPNSKGSLEDLFSCVTFTYLAFEILYSAKTLLSYFYLFFVFVHICSKKNHSIYAKHLQSNIE